MSQLFVDLLSQVVEKENVFTECLAAALREDPRLATEFLLTLCGDRLDSVVVRDAHVQIETQKGFPASGCCIDMIFTLDRQVTIGVENKLSAEEGEDQLQRYLQLDLNRIAYITARHNTVDEGVHHHQRFLRPLERGHFLWSDFYPGIEASARLPAAPLLTRALFELFKDRGFDPPKPEIGNLLDPDQKVQRENRENFAKLWETTKRELLALGWRRITTSSIAELYLKDGPSRRVKWVWLDPNWGRGGLLRIRLTPHQHKLAEVEDALRSVDLPHREDLKVRHGLEQGRIQDHEYVEVSIPLRKLLGDTIDTAVMEGLLATFVKSVLQAAG